MLIKSMCSKSVSFSKYISEKQRRDSSPSSSPSSSSSSLSTMWNFESTTSRTIRKRIDSLSSLSTLSNNPSITFVLHSLRKPKTRQWRIQSNRPLSNNEIQKYLSEQNPFDIDQTRSFHSEKSEATGTTTTKGNSVEQTSNQQLNLDRTAPNIDRVTKATQTEDFLLTRQDYPYGNLRKVNSDLLDYIAVPMDEPCVCVDL